MGRENRTASAGLSTVERGERITPNLTHGAIPGRRIERYRVELSALHVEDGHHRVSGGEFSADIETHRTLVAIRATEAGVSSREWTAGMTDTLVVAEAPPWQAFLRRRAFE